MSDNGFPILFVPTAVRRPLDFKPLSDVPKSMQELPARLAMGDLQPESFRKTSDGFEVDYRCGDFFMKLSLKGNSCYFTERYKEAELLHYMGAAKMFLGPRMVQLRIGPAEEADRLMGNDLS